MVAINSTNLLVYYIYEQAFTQFDFGMQQLPQQCCWRSRWCWYIFSCELGLRKTKLSLLSQVAEDSYPCAIWLCSNPEKVDPYANDTNLKWFDRR